MGMFRVCDINVRTLYTCEVPRSHENSEGAAVYLEVDKARPVVLYDMATGWFPVTMPEMGGMHRVRG